MDFGKTAIHFLQFRWQYGRIVLLSCSFGVLPFFIGRAERQCGSFLTPDSWPRSWDGMVPSSKAAAGKSHSIVTLD